MFQYTCPQGYLLASDGMCDPVGLSGGRYLGIQNMRAMAVKSTDITDTMTDTAYCGGQIEVIQRALIELGYNPGEPDNKMGKNTAAAWNELAADQGVAPFDYPNQYPTKAHCQAIIDALKTAEGGGEQTGGGSGQTGGGSGQTGSGGSNMDTAQGGAGANQGDEQKKEEETDYLPYIAIGAAVLIGGGILFMTMNKKKKGG
jgi:hypothetical protein